MRHQLQQLFSGVGFAALDLEILYPYKVLKVLFNGKQKLSRTGNAFKKFEL